MHNHKQAHGTVHPAPAGENIRRAPAPAHGKCKRRRDGENGQNKVPLRHLEDWNIMITPQITTNSHAADRPPKEASSAKVISTASGICMTSMTRDVRLRQSSQICGLARSRKEKTKVRAKSSLGSSASKPRPVNMVLAAWNTRFPINSAQPTASILCMIGSMTGICVRR